MVAISRNTGKCELGRCLLTHTRIYVYALFKALPPVCMKGTARGESRVANIARGETECYICHELETLTKSCILSYKRSGSALSVLLYFTLKDVLTEDTPLKFNTFIE